jgi:hypothetical protein
MCRNIKPLFNFDPPATDEEIQNAALQFVRKISGYHTPSQVNEAAFKQGVNEVAAATRKLIDTLQTTAAPHDRDIEAAKARARATERWGT